VAVALNGKRMNLQERKWLYDTISSKPEDQKVIDEVAFPYARLLVQHEC